MGEGGGGSGDTLGPRSWETHRQRGSRDADGAGSSDGGLRTSLTEVATALAVEGLKINSIHQDLASCA